MREKKVGKKEGEGEETRMVMGKTERRGIGVGKERGVVGTKRKVRSRDM